jgi:hypothetical protein
MTAPDGMEAAVQVEPKSRGNALARLFIADSFMANLRADPEDMLAAWETLSLSTAAHLSRSAKPGAVRARRSLITRSPRTAGWRCVVQSLAQGRPEPNHPGPISPAHLASLACEG